MKKSIGKRTKEAHTAPTQKGMGDHYGSAISNKMGKLRESHLDGNTSSKKYGKKPKSLA